MRRIMFVDGPEHGVIRPCEGHLDKTIYTAARMFTSMAPEEQDFRDTGIMKHRYQFLWETKSGTLIYTYEGM